MPGRGTSRQPAGVRSNARSTRNAAPRPIRSAPGPRAGSSGRCAKSGSSPTTRRSASAGSAPGRDPTPEAGPHAVGTGLGSVLSGVTAATLVRRRDTSRRRDPGQQVQAVEAGKRPSSGGSTGEKASKYVSEVSTSIGPTYGLLPPRKAVKPSPPPARKELATTRYSWSATSGTPSSAREHGAIFEPHGRLSS